MIKLISFFRLGKNVFVRSFSVWNVLKIVFVCLPVCSFRFSLVRLGRVLLVRDKAALLSIVLDREEEREERGEEGTREGREVCCREGRLVLRYWEVVGAAEWENC